MYRSFTHTHKHIFNCARAAAGVDPATAGAPSLDDVCADVLDGWGATARAQVNLPLACLREGLKAAGK
jgi:hypothetical protein